MEKRINTLLISLIFFLSMTFLSLSLTMGLARSIQGRIDPAGTEHQAPTNLNHPRISLDPTAVANRRIMTGAGSAHRQDGILTDLFEGNNLFNQGVKLNEEKDFTGAAEKFKQALTHLEKSGHFQSIALTNLNLAICYQTLQEGQKALGHFQTALEIARKNSLPKYEAKALQGKSLIFHAVDKRDEAMTYLDEAIKIHRLLADVPGEALDWLIKGIIELTRDPDRARSYFECALGLSEEIGDLVLTRKISRYLEIKRGSI